jgi:transposase-like protein
MNLFSLAKAFPDESAALDYWIKTRWPNGVECVGCGHPKVYRIVTPNKSGRNVLIFECAGCGLHFSPTAGTLFHDSHLPLQKWFMAIALMCESKKGISANQLKRHMGVTYKTAWFVCHRIRKAMSDTDITPSGNEGQVVEIDETYIGPSLRDGGKDGRRSKIKVMGIAERGGRVHFERVKNVKNDMLKPVIEARVSPNASKIVTDGAHGYKTLIPRDKHIAGNHLHEIEKLGKISNNTIEGAFSLFKRGIVGQYHRLGAEHIDAYLSEFCWRFNRRHSQPSMFGMVLSNLTANQPLPYRQLVGKTESELPPF